MKKKRCRSWIAAGTCLLAFVPIVASQAKDDSLPDVPKTIVIEGQAFAVVPVERLHADGFRFDVVPREENAYWVYQEARDICTVFSKDIEGPNRELVQFILNNPWPEGEGSHLEAILLSEDIQAGLQILLRASEMDRLQYYYYHSGSKPGSPIGWYYELRPYRDYAKLLVLNGRLLEKYGNVDGAIDYYTSAMCLGAQLTDGIELIGSLVSISCMALGEQGIMDVIGRPDLSSKQAQTILAEMLKIHSELPDPVQTIKKEQTFSHAVTHCLFDSFCISTCDSLLGNNLTSTNTSIQKPDVSNGWNRLLIEGGRVLLPDRTIQQHFDKHYDQLYSLAADYPGIKPTYDESIYLMSLPKWDVLASILLPSLERCTEMHFRIRMQTRLITSATAIRLYMTQHDGQFPKTLAEIQQYVPEDILIDPYSNESFVYKVDENGWKLYSISYNMIDDGGIHDSRFETNDYVIQYPAPAPEPFIP